MEKINSIEKNKDDVIWVVFFSGLYKYENMFEFIHSFFRQNCQVLANPIENTHEYFVVLYS